MVKSIQMHRPKFTTHADGSDAVLFMHEIMGETDGPTIGISGSIHGNENAGSQAILDLFRMLQGHAAEGADAASCRWPMSGPSRSTTALRRSTN